MLVRLSLKFLKVGEVLTKGVSPDDLYKFLTVLIEDVVLKSPQ
jgi:hypothetical protein